MKRIFLALAVSALLLPTVWQAKSAEVSVDFFYNNLSGGSWIEVGDYGYCWQPDVVGRDPNWRPYTDGYWAYTDVGWTWVSYEDFGWATYHYGRWARLADYGWVWVPGDYLEWGPAWVSWRTGGDYVGWAPLPPGGGIVYESSPITGQVDIEFDIGPAYYNFVDVRYIGEPVLRERIVDVRQNVTYINQTVNVTNITVQNNTVYNYGPDVNTLNQRSSRPIQRLRLERQENADVAAAAKSGGLTKVQGNSLVVAAPMKINKPAQRVAPPAVKTKVAQPKIEKGWSVVGDANAQSELKQKIRTQDLKKVPPPTAPGKAAAGAPAASAAPTVAATPFERGKHKGRAGEPVQPGMAGTPAGSPGGATSPIMGPEHGKHKEHKGERGEQFGGTPPVTGQTAAPEGAATPEGKHKGRIERGNVSPPPGGAASPGETFNEPRGKHRRIEEAGTPPTGQTGQGGPQQTGPQGGPYGESRGKHKAEGVSASPAGSPTGAAAGGHKHEGKKTGETESPAPSP